MINSQNLIDKICTKITAGGLTSLETCQTNGALSILSSPVCSVASVGDLPDATTYNGRMIYVDNENRYYSALMGIWTKDFKSTIQQTDSLIWMMGANNGGSFGNNSVANTSSPVSIIGNFTDWCQVSVGQRHTLAIRPNGTIWAWGCGTNGQLGDGTTVTKSSPISVVGGFVDWCRVGAGDNHSFGIRTNGTLWAWGVNCVLGPGNIGALGDNTCVNRSSPVSVVGGFTDWCWATGNTSCFSLGLRTNGTAWGWGNNARGNLGNNATLNRSSPVSVVGGFTDWSQISAGSFFGAGVRTNGSLWTWGCNGAGQLGDNTTINKSSPVSVVGGFTDWSQVSTGSSHSLGLRTNGTVWAWGQNSQAQVGDNSTVNRSSPVSVVGGFTDWCQIAAGSATSTGLRTNGTAWSWGSGGGGQVGDGTTIDRSSPVSILGNITSWCSISSRNHTALIRTYTKGC